MTVDFPEPLPPTRPTVLPAGILRFNPCKIGVSGIDGQLKSMSWKSISPLTYDKAFPFLSSKSILGVRSIIWKIRVAATVASVMEVRFRRAPKMLVQLQNKNYDPLNSN